MSANATSVSVKNLSIWSSAKHIPNAFSCELIPLFLMALTISYLDIKI